MSIEAMLETLRRLARLPADAAKAAAPLVEKAARSTAAAGTSPEGETWKPKKDGGGKVLANAPAAVSAVAIDNSVQVILKGHHVFHHYGTKRDPKRPIIPEKDEVLPAPMADAVKRAAEDAFKRTTGQ